MLLDQLIVRQGHQAVDEIKIKKESDFIKLRVSGKSFLHNQIRIMVGTLIQVGKDIFKENGY